MAYTRLDHLRELWRTKMVKLTLATAGAVLLLIHWRDQIVERPITIREFLAAIPLSANAWLVICILAIGFVVAEASYELVKKKRQELERLRSTIPTIQQTGKMGLMLAGADELSTKLNQAVSLMPLITGVNSRYPLDEGWKNGKDQSLMACCELYYFQRAYRDFQRQSSWATSGLAHISRLARTLHAGEATQTELHEMISDHKDALRQHAAKLLEDSVKETKS